MAIFNNDENRKPGTSPNNPPDPLKMGMKNAMKQGGITGMSKFMADNGMPEQGSKLLDTYSKIKDQAPNPYKESSTVDEVIKSRALSKVYATVLNTPPEAREAVYKNTREGVKREFGINLPEQLDGDVLMSIGSVGNETNNLHKAVMSDPQVAKAFGGNLTKTFTPEGEGKINDLVKKVVSKQPLTGTTKTRVQKEVLELDDDLDILDDLKASFDPEFLTYMGQLKDFTYSTIDKLQGIPILEDLGSEEQRDFLRRREDFMQKTDSSFLIKMAQKSGATVSAHELERNEKAFLNGELSPTKYFQRLEGFIQDIQRAVNKKKKLLSEGIEIGENNDPKLSDKQRELKDAFNF